MVGTIKEELRYLGKKLLLCIYLGNSKSCLYLITKFIVFSFVYWKVEWAIPINKSCNPLKILFEQRNVFTLW